MDQSVNVSSFHSLATRWSHMSFVCLAMVLQCLDVVVVVVVGCHGNVVNYRVVVSLSAP